MIEVNGLAHVILTVSDWDKARAFYAELLPFLNWRRANCPERPLTRHLLADYARVDPFEYVPAAYRAGWVRTRAPDLQGRKRPPRRGR